MPDRDLDDCIADGGGTPKWAVAPWKIPALSPEEPVSNGAGVDHTTSASNEVALKPD